MMLHVNWI
jgi:hypothetical protein